MNHSLSQHTIFVYATGLPFTSFILILLVSGDDHMPYLWYTRCNSNQAAKSCSKIQQTWGLQTVHSQVKTECMYLIQQLQAKSITSNAKQPILAQVSFSGKDHHYPSQPKVTNVLCIKDSNYFHKECYNPQKAGLSVILGRLSDAGQIHEYKCKSIRHSRSFQVSKVFSKCFY